MRDDDRTPDLAAMIAQMDERGSLELIRRRLESGEDPLVLIDECRHGMELVGDLYERGTYYISALIMAGEIFREASEILLPRITTPPGVVSAGTIVVATVKGDIHDVGKGIAITLMETHGFEIVDLGVDVPAERIAREVVERRPQALGLSCLLTSAFAGMKATIAMVRERTAHFDRPLPIVIGGAPINENVRAHVQADGWCRDAAVGVKLIQRLMA